MRGSQKFSLVCRRSFSVGHSARLSPPTISSEIDSDFSYDLETIFDSIESEESTGNITRRAEHAVANVQASGMSDTQLRRRRDRMNVKYGTLGANTSKTHSPRQALHSPESLESTNIEALVAAQAHLGHSTALWNPVTQPYIYGLRNGIHLFDLEITLTHLRWASQVIKGVAQNDGKILFVGTRSGQKRIVVEAARRANGYQVFDRWVPGTITNGKQVVGHGKVRNLVTKHVRNNKPSSNSLDAPNSILPDLVVVLNPLENRNLLKECAKGRVPTIGIIDSDADPRWVTYAIPANDDSLRCVSLIAGLLSRAAAQGREGLVMPDWEQIEL